VQEIKIKQALILVELISQGAGKVSKFINE
jgi:hypothetical protein